MDFKKRALSSRFRKYFLDIITCFLVLILSRSRRKIFVNKHIVCGQHFVNKQIYERRHSSNILGEWDFFSHLNMVHIFFGPRLPLYLSFLYAPDPTIAYILPHITVFPSLGAIAEWSLNFLWNYTFRPIICTPGCMLLLA